MKPDESSDFELLSDAQKVGNEDEIDDEPKIKKTTQRRAKYVLNRTFETTEDFEEWWSNESTGWHITKAYTSKKTGVQTEYYSCLTKGCYHKLKVLFSVIDESIQVEVDSAGHDEEAHSNGTLLTLEIKAEIQKWASTLKPKAIRLKLLEKFNSVKVPTLLQIQNFVTQVRKKEAPSKPLTDADLIKYANENSDIPEDENFAFVAGFMKYENGHFLLAWSTPKLIQIQSEAQLLATDATYKLNWYGFPVFVAGTIDCNSSFHPTFLALASHEDSICFKKFFEVIAQATDHYPTHVLADAAHSITNAAVSVFPDAIRLMCWAHAIKNIDQKLKHLEPEVKTQIRREIETLQYSMSEEQFRNASNLLLQKWADEFEGEEDEFPFIEYFRSVWLDSPHFRWFEGASEFPSTNNALESHNKQIKDSHSLRERLPFNKFVLWAEKMVALDWSAGRPTLNEVKLKNHPHLFVSARQLHNSNRQVFVVRAGEEFGVPSAEKVGLNSRQFKEAARLLSSSDFESFEEYSDARFKVYIVSKVGNGFSCTCRVGSKKHLCKHSVFVACKLGVMTYPPDALAQPLDQKRKRGRPKKAQTQSQSRN